ncbi:MAG TPA: hypothetical protein VFS10_22715 [Pyrinomonadaceae bacterium]|nr:hypothetical protein [Pyrinomonadaceae bacterium]
MKKQIMRAFAICGLLLTLAATAQTASAQGTRRLVVNIPFDFTAGRELLPAGRYTIKRVAKDSARALLIRSEDGRASVTVLTNTAERGGELPQVSFKRYGDRYFLASVSEPGVEAARALPASSLEKQLRRELAKGSKTKGDESNVAATVTIKAGVR